MAVKKKKGLGRGLDALISPTTSLTTHSETTAPKNPNCNHIFKD